jgi:hypothetical protein
MSGDDLICAPIFHVHQICPRNTEARNNVSWLGTYYWYAVFFPKKY